MPRSSRSSAAPLRYPKLFEPGGIGSLELSNRIVKSPLACGLANMDGTVPERLVDHYPSIAPRGAARSESGLRPDRDPRRARLPDHEFPLLTHERALRPLRRPAGESDALPPRGARERPREHPTRLPADAPAERLRLRAGWDHDR